MQSHEKDDHFDDFHSDRRGSVYVPAQHKLLDSPNEEKNTSLLKKLTSGIKLDLAKKLTEISEN